jgi:hypothetical protein
VARLQVSGAQAAASVFCFQIAQTFGSMSYALPDPLSWSSSKVADRLKRGPPAPDFPGIPVQTPQSSRLP